MDKKTELILLLHTRKYASTSKADITLESRVGKRFSDQIDLRNKLVQLATLISNKINFKLKSIKRDKEGHFIFVTGKIHQ